MLKKAVRKIRPTISRLNKNEGRKPDPRSSSRYALSVSALSVRNSTSNNNTSRYVRNSNNISSKSVSNNSRFEFSKISKLEIISKSWSVNAGHSSRNSSNSKSGFSRTNRSEIPERNRTTGHGATGSSSKFGFSRTKNSRTTLETTVAAISRLIDGSRKNYSGTGRANTISVGRIGSRFRISDSVSLSSSVAGHIYSTSSVIGSAYGATSSGCSRPVITTA